MKRTLFIVFLLTACAPISRHPLGGVEKMSGETLCYRAAYAAPDPAITAEITARNLDCASINPQARIGQ